MVAGGRINNYEEWNISTVGILTGELGYRQFPNLPTGIDAMSLTLNNGKMLICGGWNNEKKCLQLENGTWKVHSILNNERLYHSAVTTSSATFLFGSYNSWDTYEYLPKDSTTWLPGKTGIPIGFESGCAIAVKSEKEIWLIGGCGTNDRILSFNVSDQTFQELHSQLNVGRFRHRCAFIPNTKKIMITGGEGYDPYANEGYGSIVSLNSTEIIDTEDGSITMGNPMNFKRNMHGMGVVTINGINRLVVFGGFDAETELKTVELYNTQTQKWEITNIKLSEEKQNFGFLTVNLADIYQNFNAHT